MNWLDIVIVLLCIYFIYDGWEKGFVTLLANFFSFLASLWLAIKYHNVVGKFFVEKFGIPSMWQEVLGYIAVAFIAEFLITHLLYILIRKFPKKILTSSFNKWFGSVMSLVNALVLSSFFFLVILSFPIRGTIKQDIHNSKIASVLVRGAQTYGGGVTSSLDTAARSAIQFFTIDPSSSERVTLPFPDAPFTLSMDINSQQAMLMLVNSERKKIGLSEVILDVSMSAVALSKSRDMFSRRYFSHYDPEGKSVGDHFAAAGIIYTIVGENLAYAPDVTSAHTGLMNSPGHRENILDPEYRRIGLGVIDGGIYGKMFTQVFAD